MRIIQLTDLHVGQPDADSYGVDVRGNFLNVLSKALHLWPDLLIITGDLCLDRGDAEIYHWVKTELDRSNVPYLVIGGNHDDAPLLAAVFGQEDRLKNDEFYYLETIADRQVLFLDSSTGLISDAQLQWLEATLTDSQEEPQLIFMHHPPLLAGVAYMDTQHSLRNWDVVADLLNQQPFSVEVFCGHYHVHKSIQLHNLSVHITPSTYFQIDQFQTNFQVDHYRPGFRVIDLVEGQIRETVRFVDPLFLATAEQQIAG